jgi:hypothetical protein
VRSRLQRPLAAAHDREKGHRPFLRLLQVGGLGQLARQLRQIFVCEPLKAGSKNWALN